MHHHFCSQNMRSHLFLDKPRHAVMVVIFYVGWQQATMVSLAIMKISSIVAQHVSLGIQQELASGELT